MKGGGQKREREEEEGRGERQKKFMCLPFPSPHPGIRLSPTLCWVLFRHWGDCAVGTTIYLPGSSNSRRKVDLGSGQHSDS